MWKSEMRKSFVALCCCMAIGLGSLFMFTPDAFSAEKVKWDLAIWGGKRAISIPMDAWAEEMAKVTNGGWTIKVHYGGVLSPARESIDGIKAGMFDATYFTPLYTPGKLPLNMVSALPFITPMKNEEISRMTMEVWKHPAIMKELARWNAVPGLPAFLPQYNLMGNKPLKSVKDLNGMRIRVSGEQARALKLFGAVPTMVTAPETYEAIDRGTLDQVAFGWYAHGAYKIYEVSKYATEINLGAPPAYYIFNKKSWEALPEEYRKAHLKYLEKAPKLFAAEMDKADAKWLPIFKKKLDFSVFPKAEHDKLVAKSKPVLDAWVADKEKRGLPGKDVLNYYLQKRKEIAGF